MDLSKKSYLSYGVPGYPHPCQTPIFVLWHFPVSRWMKINFDGALQLNSVGNVSIVIRNYLGRVINARIHQLINITFSMVELIEARKACRCTVFKLRAYKSWIKGDALG